MPELEPTSPHNFASSSSATPAPSTPSTSLDEDINRSSLKALRDTSVEASWYLVIVIIAAVGTKALSYLLPLLFRLLRWTTSSLLSVLEWILVWTSYILFWLSLLALALFALVYLVLGVAYLIIKHLPFFDRHATATRYTLLALAHSPLLLVRRYAPTWLFATISLLLLARLALPTSFSLPLPSLSRRSTLSSTSTPTIDDPNLLSRRQAFAAEAERQRLELEARQRLQAREEAEKNRDRGAQNWARQMQEELLREGLTRRAQQAAGVGAEATEEGGATHDGARRNSKGKEKKKKKRKESVG